MKTQTQVHRLQGGQALALQGRSAGPAVLVDGELLVQQPARWLAGVVVFPAPTRLVAPATLPAGRSLTFVAVRASSVIAEVAPPLLSRRGLAAAAAWFRGLLRDGGGRRRAGVSG